MTYNDDNLPEGDLAFTLNRTDVDKFLHDLRQKIDRSYEEKYNIRYFLCGEYGDHFDRPHYHCVLFNFPMDISDPARYLEDIWRKGFVTVDQLTPQRAKYVAKYVCKVRSEKYEGCEKPFAMMSTKPGLGYKLLQDTKIVSWHKRTLNFTMYDDQGTPYAMPKFYRDRIFSFKARKHRSEMFSFAEYSSQILDIGKLGLERWYSDSVRNTRNLEQLFYKRIDEKLLR